MDLLKKFKFLLPILFTILVIGCFHFTKLIALKWYPPVVNFAFFMLFFTSLFSESTIIQRIAKAMDGNLNEAALKYTRNLTYIWAVFLFINFSISVSTVFLSEKIWMVYNGFISYMLIGMFFMIEYPIRVQFKRKYGE